MSAKPRKHSWYQPYSFVKHYYCRWCGITKKSKNPRCTWEGHKDDA
jgi:hypothetical protein